MWHRQLQAPPTVHVQVSTDNALMTALYTLIGGVILFLLSEVVRGLMIKPTIKARELRGTIIDRVIFYQNQLLGATLNNEAQNAISGELRSLATQYRAAMTGIYGYRVAQFFRFVPSRDQAEAISRNLVGLSNSVPPEIGRGEPTNPHIERNEKYIRSLGRAIGFDFGIGE